MRNAINGLMVDELHSVLADVERQPRFLIPTGGAVITQALLFEDDEKQRRMRDFLDRR